MRKFTCSTAILIVTVLASLSSAQVNVIQVGDEVRIFGTSMGDSVLVRTTGSEVIVETPTMYSFPRNQISVVVAQLRGGDDVFDASSCLVSCVVDGGAGNDLITGSQRPDDIFGGAGDDEIRGENGSDFLSGQGGRDSIDGGRHNDVILGGNSRDLLVGGDGADIVDGGPGQDILLGGILTLSDSQIESAQDIWFSSDVFNIRVFEITLLFFSNVPAADDFEIDTLIGGDEADILAPHSLDDAQVDGLGWPGGVSPPGPMDRVDNPIPLGLPTF